MMEEIFDVCDANDQVIGTATRDQVHQQNLLHRAVHIWVWNSSGELMIQRRSASKDQFPSRFTSSASGHVDSGETYEEAAIRELQEELQLQGDLISGCKLPASERTAYEHTVLYHLQSDDCPVPDPFEIAEILYFTTDRIAAMLSAAPEEFTPPFQELFSDWWKQEHRTANDVTNPKT